jgi:SAM-dependent methyltransferase
LGVNRRAFDDVDPDRPSAARIYDYLLGGYHNFEADRVAAERFREMLPNVPLYMRANRVFLRRVVSHLAEQGMDQFLDIGSGIPTVGNVHEVAQKINPSARVVYVDVDPVAVRHSEEILKGSPNTTVIQADLRRPEAILDHQELGRLLDLNKPTVVLLLAVLLFVTDDEEAYRVVRVLREALAPDSYIAISHPTDDGLPQEDIQRAKSLYAAIGSPVNIRSYDQTERFFDGLELVEPGLVYVSDWRPEDLDDPFFERPGFSGYYGGVGRKP